MKVILVLLLAGGIGASATDTPFVGIWKLNKDKSQYTGFREVVNDLGDNKYEFAYGDDKQTIVADGADHPTKYGDTWAMKQESPDKWVFITKRNGKVTGNEIWTYTNGGNTLTIDHKGTHADGSSYTNKEVLKRVSGGPGIAGVWESQSEQFTPVDWEIKPWGTDGLSLITPADKEHLELKFDGKQYPDHGPRVAPGSTASAKRIDDHTIELTDKLNGKAVDTQELKLSDDGKTLTVTVHSAGVEKPMILVFEKQ